MCQNDVEKYFSLQRARIASGHPTVIQFFESAATNNTNLLLTSEFDELHERAGSHDPNEVKIPLLWRNNSKCHPEHDKQFSLEQGESFAKCFLPLTVTQGTFDKAQMLELLRHAKQTLKYINLSTSTTIIWAYQIIVNAMKNEVNKQHLLHFISCLDNGLRMHSFNIKKWTENSLVKALFVLEQHSNSKILWNNTYFTYFNEFDTPLTGFSVTINYKGNYNFKIIKITMINMTMIKIWIK